MMPWRRRDSEEKLGLFYLGLLVAAILLWIYGSIAGSASPP